jgi:hypothetical protein
VDQAVKKCGRQENSEFEVVNDGFWMDRGTEWIDAGEKIFASAETKTLGCGTLDVISTYFFRPSR